jgi:radical SAM protein with 4Fe4S-binding SPASM domain
MDKKHENLQKIETSIKESPLICDSKPRDIYLENTSRCNLKCITCPRTYLPFFKGKDLDTEVFEIAKKELFPYLTSITINGFGEPMISSKFGFLLEEISKNNITPRFVTNGMCLTEEWIRVLLKHNISFGVSLDGAHEDTMRKIRKGASLKKIVASMHLFSDIKKREHLNSGSSIETIVFVGLKSNIKDLPDLVTLASDLGIPKIIVLHLSESIHPPWVRRQSLRHHKQLANKYFMIAKERAEKLGVDLLVNLFATGNDINPKRNTAPESTRYTRYRFSKKCPIPWTSAVIKTNGDVTPCCACAEIMGNVKKKGFANVWNNSKYRNFRKRINTNFPPLDCRNCNLNFGINSGNPENAKKYEKFTQKIIYFFEYIIKLIKHAWHYLKDYL